MAYMDRRFDAFLKGTVNPDWPDHLNSPMLQSPGVLIGTELISDGRLEYLDFIILLKRFWEEAHPDIPVLPFAVNRQSFVAYGSDNDPTTVSAGNADLSVASGSTGSGYLDQYPAIIGYSLELRKAHTTEPKPRMRQNVMNNSYTIYGQKFQNIIGFSVMSKVGTFQGQDSTTTRDDLDAAVLCDRIMEVFEDFMVEFTPIFKACGAADLVYSRRLSDSEINRDGSDIHKRTVTYLLTTEKTYKVENEVIQSISIDARSWFANKNVSVSDLATPNHVDVSIVDLFNSATPDS
jgi:hypothetical protein